MEVFMKLPTCKSELDHVAHRFEWARLRLNLRIVEVVRETGTQNINKGCRRLRAIENGSPQPLSIYNSFAPVLDIDLDELHEELEDIREQRRQKIRQDMPPRILGALLEKGRQSLDLVEDEVIARTALEPPEDYVRRFRRLEAGKARFPTDDEIEAFGSVLLISPKAIRRAFEKERRPYDRRDDGPELLLRAIPAVAVRLPIPHNRSTKWYLDYAGEYAEDRQVKVCLVFGDGRSVYINPNGTRIECYQPPHMTLRYSL